MTFVNKCVVNLCYLFIIYILKNNVPMLNIYSKEIKVIHCHYKDYHVILERTYYILSEQIILWCSVAELYKQNKINYQNV